MPAIRPKQLFKNLNITSGQSVDSEAVNLIEIRPEGNFGFQYTKNTGGGKLKVTLLVSINGTTYKELAEIPPVVEETTDDADGFGTPRPPIVSYVKFRATAVGGNITNLNGWAAIQ